MGVAFDIIQNSVVHMGSTWKWNDYRSQMEQNTLCALVSCNDKISYELETELLSKATKDYTKVKD